MLQRLLTLLLVLGPALALPQTGLGATCADTQVLDDFEQYNDACERLFFSWTDGFGHSGSSDCGVASYAGNGTGSMVGNADAPFAEQNYVHSGSQALIMEYHNSGTTLVSTSERWLDSPTDLTAGGTMAGLRLWYQGRIGSAGGLTYNAGTYTMFGIGMDVAGYEDSFQYAYAGLTGNSTIVAKLDSLTPAKGKAGIMIRNGLEANDVYAAAFVTASGGATFQFRVVKGGNTQITASTVNNAQWIRLTRTGSTFKGEYSSNGSQWHPIQSDDSQDPSEFSILMSGDTYVGLALTSGSAGSASEAVFSNVTMSGSVSGSPLGDSMAIGLKTNDPAPVLFGLEDASGAQVLIPHPNGYEASLANYWTSWEIRFDDFYPVDPTQITRMIVSVGDGQTESRGTLYVDDIAAIRRISMPELMPLFSEDFEGLDLGPNIDESVPGDAVVTQNAPAGWMLDDSGVDKAGDPANGVDEWEGWSFADNDWWASVGDQRRSEFTLACGAVAVADSDEYDDKGDTGSYNAFMSTPEIDVLSVLAGDSTLVLRFDSSWRPESDQTATIEASFDGGSAVEILHWESSGDLYHDHSTNELVTVTFDRPVGAQKLVLTFGYFNASNNWWWAVDNLELLGVPRIYLLKENFDNMPLGPNVEENSGRQPGDWVQAWTDTPPAGWIIDESSVPGVGNPATDGVTEWAGWAIADKDFWVNSDGQRREEFTKASGNVIVADCDEWDDDAHPGNVDDPYDTWFTTPVLDISEIIPGTMKLKFDSSWRPEFDSWYHQSALITISYDGAEPIEILRWESDPASPFYKNDNSTNDTIEIELNNPPKAHTAEITFGMFDAGNDWWWAIDNIMVSGQPKSNQVRLLSEDFEGVSLGLSPEETIPAPQDVWTDALPGGWVRDNSGMPFDTENDGVTEWLGWNVANKDWWAYVAGNQRRSEFVLGQGAVLIADSDEWDDAAHPAGSFNAFVDTPAIDVSGAGSHLTLQFASSWRPEVNQTATVTASFDGKAPVEILRWESQAGSPYFHEDGTYISEQVTVDITKPAGAQTVVLTFGKSNANNNWWWAVDNIELTNNGKTLFFEDFESLTLGQPVDEAPAPPPADIAEIWSDTAPAGWINDRSLMPGIGDLSTDGVTDWAGWAFAKKDWWVVAAGDQERSQFFLGEGTVAVADPDEWDDAPHANGLMNAFLISPVVDIPAGVLPGTLRLKFDSSWRREDTQTAVITASYDGGEPFEVLRWESEGADTGFLKDDATNESVNIALQNPEGAANLVITFGMIDGGNDWWWAIDNIEVTGEVSP